MKPEDIIATLFPSMGKVAKSLTKTANTVKTTFDGDGPLNEITKNNKNFKVNTTTNMRKTIDRLKTGDFYSSDRAEKTVQDAFMGGDLAEDIMKNGDFDFSEFDDVMKDADGSFDLSDDLFSDKVPSKENKDTSVIKKIKNEKNTVVNNNTFNSVNIDTSKLEKVILENGLLESNTIQKSVSTILTNEKAMAEMTSNFRSSSIELMDSISNSLNHIASNTKKENPHTNNRNNSVLDVLTGRKTVGEFFGGELGRFRNDISNAGMFTNMTSQALQNGDPLSIALQLMGGSAIEGIDNKFLGGRIGSVNRILNQGKVRATSAAKNGLDRIFDDPDAIINPISTKVGKVPLLGGLLKDQLDGVRNKLDKKSPLYKTFQSIMGLDEESNSPTAAKFRDPSTQVAFDSETHTTINKVLPGYLRKMLSVVSGEEELYHDYRSGKWMTGSKVRDAFVSDAKTALGNNDNYGFLSNNKSIQKLLSDKLITQDDLNDTLYTLATNKVSSNRDFDQIKARLNPMIVKAIEEDKSGGALGIQAIATYRDFLLNQDNDNPNRRHSFIGNMTDALSDALGQDQLQIATRQSGMKGGSGSPESVFDRIERNMDMYGEMVNIVEEIRDYLKDTDPLKGQVKDIRDTKPTDEVNVVDNKPSQDKPKTKDTSDSPDTTPVQNQQSNNDTDEDKDIFDEIDDIKDKYKSAKNKFSKYKEDTNGMTSREKAKYLKDKGVNKAKSAVKSKVNGIKDELKGNYNEFKNGYKDLKNVFSKTGSTKGTGGMTNIIESAIKDTTKGADKILPSVLKKGLPGLVGAIGGGSALSGLLKSPFVSASGIATSGATLRNTTSFIPESSGIANASATASGAMMRATNAATNNIVTPVGKSVNVISGKVTSAASTVANRAKNMVAPETAMGKVLSGGKGLIGSLGSKMPGIVGKVGGGLLKSIPILGTAIAGGSAIADLMHGNIGGAALNALSMIPGVGGLVAAGASVLGGDKLINGAINGVGNGLGKVAGGIGEGLVKSAKFAFDVSPLGMMANIGTSLFKQAKGLGLKGDPLKNPESLAKLGFSLSPIGMMFGIGDAFSSKANYFGKFFKKFNKALLKVFKVTKVSADDKVTKTGGGGTTTNTSDIDTSGGSTAEQVWNAFTSAGYSKEQTAGVMGNMYGESGMTADRGEVGGGGGYGLVQWTPSSKIDNYISAVGHGDKKSVKTQVEFLIAQLDGSSPVSAEPGAGAQLKATSTVEEATRAFAQYYERPAAWALEQSLPKRIQAAKDYYNQFKNKSGGKKSSKDKDSKSGKKGGSGSSSVSNNSNGSDSQPTATGDGKDKTTVGKSSNSDRSGASAKIEKMIQYAKSKIGSAYSMAVRTGPQYDCSGLVYMSMKDAGFKVPGAAWATPSMYADATGAHQYIKKIDAKDAGRGDIIIWGGPGGAGAAGHTAIILEKYKGDLTHKLIQAVGSVGVTDQFTEKDMIVPQEDKVYARIVGTNGSKGGDDSSSEANSSNGGSNDAESEDPFKDMWLNESDDDKKKDIERIKGRIDKRYDAARKGLEAAQKAQAAGATDAQISKAVNDAISTVTTAGSGGTNGNGGQGIGDGTGNASNSSTSANGGNASTTNSGYNGTGRDGKDGKNGRDGRDGKDGVTTLIYRGITGDEVNIVKRIKENTAEIYETLLAIYGNLQGVDSKNEKDILGQIITALGSGNNITTQQLGTLQDILNRMPTEGPFLLDADQLDPILRGF